MDDCGPEGGVCSRTWFKCASGRVELSFLGPKIVFAEYGLAVIVGGARKEAEKSELDPNKSFNNLELVVAEQIGTETMTYVRNICKDYIAYKLTVDAQPEADKARSRVAHDPS